MQSQREGRGGALVPLLTEPVVAAVESSGGSGSGLQADMVIGTFPKQVVRVASPRGESSAYLVRTGPGASASSTGAIPHTPQH